MLTKLNFVDIIQNMNLGWRSVHANLDEDVNKGKNWNIRTRQLSSLFLRQHFERRNEEI